jgi:ABC-type transporter Mla maintaining outer membrane lipid asymmetry ATPase subunit MlaF
MEIFYCDISKEISFRFKDNSQRHNKLINDIKNKNNVEETMKIIEQYLYEYNKVQEEINILNYFTITWNNQLEELKKQREKIEDIII